MILDVAAEEMLHWALVQNLLTAVGSAPFVSRPYMPHQAKGYPPGVQFRLLPFGETALQHFVYVERPEGMEVRRRRGVRAGRAVAAADGARGGHPPRPGVRHPGPPVSIRRAGLRAAGGVDRRGRAVHRPGFHQADETTFGWPDLVPITDLAGANRALERIVEQGEGATGDWRTAHYGRFLGVLGEYLQMRDADPTFQPTHPVVGAGMRAVEGIEPDVYITDPDTGGCSDLFNATYELMLQMIARYFAFGHETPEQRQVLANVAVGLMFGVIKPLGLLLARLPVGPDHPAPRRVRTSSSPTGRASCCRTAARPGSASRSASTSWAPSPTASVRPSGRTSWPTRQRRCAGKPRR